MLKRLALPFMVAALLFSSSAAATTISQFVSYSVNQNIVIDQLHINPFDTSLGTLDNVHVAIFGQISINGMVLGLTPYEIRVGLDFFGLGGKYFDFTDPGIQMIFQGAALPYQVCSLGCVPIFGPLIIPPATFNLAFSFDRQFQELTGINQGFIDSFTMGGANAAIPPVVISGAVTGFQSDLFALDEVDVLMSHVPIGNMTALTTIVNGTMSISYDYTPVEAVVPLPPAILLFGSGLLLLFKKVGVRAAAHRNN